jgi:ketosteroid isomerase-like protein
MAEHPDAQLVRQGYDAFIAGDMGWLNEHLAETIVWHVPGNNVLSGDYRGKEEVLSFFARSVQAAIPNFDVHDVVASEDHAIALLNIRFTRNDNGQTVEGRAVQVFHIEEGMALESWFLNEDQAALDAFLEGVKV